MLESCILFSGSLFSMLGEVLTPKVLESTMKYWIYFLSAVLKSLQECASFYLLHTFRRIKYTLLLYRVSVIQIRYVGHSMSERRIFVKLVGTSGSQSQKKLICTVYVLQF